MTIQCAIYARVSNERNQGDNSSLDAQTRRGREYAHEHGWHVVTEAREMFSGKEDMLIGRAEWGRIMGLAEQGQISRIVVDHSDRLGRGEGLSRALSMAALFGCTIVFLKRTMGTVEIEDDGSGDGWIDWDDKDATKPIQRAAATFVDVASSGAELHNITRRMAGGKCERARSGHVVASPQRPYGYQIVSDYDDRGRKVSCNFEIDEEEAEHVRQIFEWAVYDNLSTYRIAQKLTEMRVLTQRAKDPRYSKDVKPHQWQRSTVRQILRNETYAGTWHYRKFRTKRIATGPGKVHKRAQERPRDDPKRIAVTCPPIVSRELWKAAQESLKARSNGGRTPSRQYLLRGIIACGQCGHNMTGSVSRSKNTAHGYYRCRWRKAEVYDQGCPSSGGLRHEHADAMVWEYIIEMLQDGDDIRRQLERQRQEAERANHALALSIAALDAQTDKDRGRLERLLDLYEAGGLSIEQYKDRTDKIKAGIQKREQERADLESRMTAAGAFSEADIADFERMRKRALVAVEHATFEEKRQLLAMLSVKCIWNGQTKELAVTGAFGGGKLHVVSRSQVRFAIPFATVLTLPARLDSTTERTNRKEAA